MSIGILGKKLGMTRVYDEGGIATAVTVIQADPNVIAQVKTKEKDGYASVQLVVGRKSPRQTPKPQLGHFKKAGIDSGFFVREFRLDGNEQVALGEKLTVSRFQVGQMVDVIGISKGRGFQGVVKKHNFDGQPDSHGSMMHRRTGAIGCRSTPGRIFKNAGMPGHMGDERVTVQNLKVVQVREGDNVLLIRGAVPGARGSYVVVRNAIKAMKPKAQKK
ncbi:MAG: 50S ribosomal protein L3 [bacterium]